MWSLRCQLRYWTNKMKRYATAYPKIHTHIHRYFRSHVYNLLNHPFIMQVSLYGVPQCCTFLEFSIFNLSHSVQIVSESAISSWETDPLEVVT
jgi:hypothetical protein